MILAYLIHLQYNINHTYNDNIHDNNNANNNSNNNDNTNIDYFWIFWAEMYQNTDGFDRFGHLLL